MCYTHPTNCLSVSGDGKGPAAPFAAAKEEL